MLDRRDFLKNAGLTGSLFALPSLLKAQPETRTAGIDLSVITLKGKVQSQGNGIAGVAVTDGINIVQTDKSGRYELKSNATAEFVYISLPAGYAIPEEKGIAAFYKPVTKSSVQVNDFNLTKLATDDRKHNFVVWADPQIISAKDAALLKTQSAPDLKALVASYPAGTLWHGIGCGDLVWDHFELFEDYKQAVEITGVPFYNLIGNHDMDIDARTDDGSANTFKQQFGPTYYSYNRGAIHYVVLDDVFFIGNAKKYIGYITENQLRWLEQDLATVTPGSTVVVSLHIPTLTGQHVRDKKEEEFGGTVSNRKQLYKLLAPFKVHIMSGHTHFNDNWEEGNIMEHNHGTVCGAWWTGPICGDGTPSGYGVYSVKGTELSWHYQSTGREADHQVRIHVEDKDAGSKKLQVNVWNYDPAWKVECWVDGARHDELKRGKGFDAMAVLLYEGPQLPKPRGFAEPKKTDHLFESVIPTAAKQVKIVATDRFGKQYTADYNV